MSQHSQSWTITTLLFTGGTIHKTSFTSYAKIDWSLLYCSDLTEKPDIKAMDSDKTVGTLRGVTGCLGIALLRVADVMKASGLYTISEDGKRVPLTAHIPSWWPEGITG